MAVLVFAAACAADSTELVVVVNSDLRVPAELDEVAIGVEGPSGVRQEDAVTLATADGPALPLILYLEPRGNTLAPVTITATGRRSGGDVVTASIRTGFLRGRSLLVRLDLHGSCVGVVCAAGESCRSGACVSADVPAEELPPWRGDAGEPEPEPDAGAARDGAPPCPGSNTPRTFYADADRDGFGDRASDLSACEAPSGYVEDSTDCDDGDGAAHPGATEACGGADEDCDTMVDEGFECAAGDSRACTSECGTMGAEVCTAGTCTWGTCTPPAESCNGVDDDCNRLADDGVPGCGDTCSMPIPVTASILFAGTTCGAPDDADLACGQPATPDDVYVVQLDGPASVRVYLNWADEEEGNTSYRAGACPGIELGCGEHEAPFSAPLEAGDHYFVIEHDHGGCGEYQVRFLIG